MALDLTRMSMLEGAVQAAAPREVSVVCTDPRLSVPDGEVFYSEAVSMARAVPKRRTEFFAGRLAAHRAMARRGFPASPVPMGRDRAPKWPTDLVGSISHCDAACVAVVGARERYRSLAVDLEPDEPLPEDILPMVCLPREREWLARLPQDQRGRMARVIFSAKECAYKLQYPITRKVLDFSDVEVQLDPEAGRFEITVAPGINPFGDKTPLCGRFGQEVGVMFCMMYALQDIGKMK
ncbi:4'-phosphopantetheinyl transferase superfamily protein [Alisedimentitalea sp. MJ-SS2]|uniref:4'-phosphopantetheinyl transferase family protein n=1 Tax=Aliisedimentitalea sp. MJ-SS2 TaxID=3049795 RepID=UPI002913B6A1|nr:4'-phosphopantetheinyl transferase superfamily protein [Alisedimentitalea sp. MJ-SS2]MDU8926226.1 4'-phosphopantetheinyl transferase superfamily protein [Alisedimentitalea sp. MJ-SS2]